MSHSDKVNHLPDKYYFFSNAFWVPGALHEQFRQHPQRCEDTRAHAQKQKQTMGWVQAGCERSALQIPNASRMLSAQTSPRLCRTAQTLSKTGAEIGVKGFKVLLQLMTAAGPVAGPPSTHSN